MLVALVSSVHAKVVLHLVVVCVFTDIVAHWFIFATGFGYCVRNSMVLLLQSKLLRYVRSCDLPISVLSSHC